MFSPPAANSVPASSRIQYASLAAPMFDQIFSSR
jgi:hypothetical protein